MTESDLPTVLVTGATDGIGYGTAHALAHRGWEVLLHGRNGDRLEIVRREIADRSGNGRLEIYKADFARLEEVEALAVAVANRHDSLDVLLNNAGIGRGPKDGPGREVSDDGYELRFQVNHLAALLLARRLLPLLRRAAPARIVNVASAAQTEIDFDDVMLERGYDGGRAYSQSKLAMVMATFELAGRLDPAEVTVNALHPGTLLDTKMVREGFGAPMGPVETGIDSEVHLATAPKLDGTTGKYFDRTRPARAHAQAYDEVVRSRLWQLSEGLLGLT